MTLEQLHEHAPEPLRRTLDVVAPPAGQLLSRLRRPFGEAQLCRAVERADGPVRVCVGSGTVRLPGWINTDVRWRSQFYLDATRPWPVPSGRITHVYADQVIEHFSLPDARKVLGHAFDALVPGGRIRLSTPDVERTVAMYLAGDATTDAHLARHRDHGYVAEHPVDLLRVTFGENGHRACFDYDALAAELTAAGFVDVGRCEVGDSTDPAFRGLESRTAPTEAATTLVVEATKPALAAPEGRRPGTTHARRLV